MFISSTTLVKWVKSTQKTSYPSKLLLSVTTATSSASFPFVFVLTNLRTHWLHVLFLTQIPSTILPSLSILICHPPLSPRQVLELHQTNLPKPHSTVRATRVETQVISAARKVVVEQLQPNGWVRSSQRSCQGKAHMWGWSMGERRLPPWGRRTQVADWRLRY